MMTRAVTRVPGAKVHMERTGRAVWIEWPNGTMTRILEYVLMDEDHAESYRQNPIRPLVIPRRR